MNERIVQRGDLYHCADCGEVLRAVVVQLELVVRADQLHKTVIAHHVRKDATLATLRCDGCGAELSESGGGGHNDVTRALLYNELAKRTP